MSELERLVMDGGELLAQVHSVVPDRGIRDQLQPPDERFVGRVTRVVDQAFGSAAAAVVERGADLLRKEVMTVRRRGCRSPTATGSPSTS